MIRVSHLKKGMRLSRAAGGRSRGVYDPNAQLAVGPGRRQEARRSTGSAIKHNKAEPLEEFEDPDTGETLMRRPRD